MKPSRRCSIQLAAIASACVAATACRSYDEHPPPSEKGVSLTSAQVAEERPAVGAPERAVCEPSGDEPSAGAAVAPAPASTSVVAHAARKPRALRDDAIATRGATAPRFAQPPAPSAPERSEAIGTGVTTTSAALPAARPAVVFAPARVVIENRLPSDYQLERARVLVDGAVVYDGRAPGSVWIAPGAHAVQVIASFRMNDPVFTYVRGYRIEIQSTERLPASVRPLALIATVRPKGGVTTPVNEAAGVAWRSFPLK